MNILHQTSFGLSACSAAIIALAVFSAATSTGQASAQAARDPDITLVVDRTDTSVEVFIATEAIWMDRAFGGVPAGLLNQEGHINFDDFRDGSAPFGDWMSQDWSFAVDGAPHELEAMSFMVHPTDVALPVTTPLEGYTAMSVCNAPLDQAPLPLALASLAVGYIAYPVDGFDDLSLRLNADGLDGATVRVIEFKDWSKLNDTIAVVADGGLLQLAAVNRWSLGSATWAWVLAAAAGFAMACGLVVERHLAKRKRAAQPDDPPPIL